jgi:hypothetical protein
MRNCLKSLVLRSRILCLTYHYVLQSKYCVFCNAFGNNVLRIKQVSYYLSMHKLCKLIFSTLKYH